MARAEDYRRFAAECVAHAQRSQNPGDRVKLLEMARAFQELAAKTEPEQPAPDKNPDRS